MGVYVKEVESKADIKKFVDLQFKIYKRVEMWVPPLKMGERRMLCSKTNPAFEFCKAKFWLAYKGGKCVGRIGAVINNLYNEKIREKKGRITRVEFIDDQQVSNKLFAVAEEWLKSEGMNKVHGPLGFTNLDNQGLLIEGFDHVQSIASVYHLPYYMSHFERLGYVKENDWLEFLLSLKEVPDKALRLCDIIKQRNNLRVISCKSKKEAKSHGLDFFKLLNKAFDTLPYVAPFSDEMIQFYIDKYFTVLNPDFLKIIKKDNETIAFILAIPSLSKAMKKAKGRLFPCGFWHILKALKGKNKVVDLLLTGVAPKYQSMGVPAVLIAELQQVMLAHGMKYVETTGIFETNQKAIQTWKNYEHIQHKRRRCYVKDL